MVKVRRLIKGKSKEELQQLGQRHKITLPVNMSEFVMAVKSTPSSVNQMQVRCYADCCRC